MGPGTVPRSRRREIRRIAATMPTTSSAVPAEVVAEVPAEAAAAVLAAVLAEDPAAVLADAPGAVEVAVPAELGGESVVHTLSILPLQKR
jgi:hypothetical protein